MPAFVLLLLTLLSVPLIEIYVLIRVGSSIGAINTIALCVLTAALGAFLLRQQGLSTLARVQAATERGELPALELIEGAILLVTGVMLLTPGFVTDAVGFACLVPSVRRALALGVAERFIVRRVHTRHPHRRTIEGDYRVDDD